MTAPDASVSVVVELLWQTVLELAVTVFEDHPRDTDLVFVDDLMERVSEFQGAVNDVRVAAASGDRLTELDRASDCANLIYWRDLVGFRTVYELRRAAARRPGEWRAWADGVELALERCSQPLQDLRVAIRLAWTDAASDAVTNTPRRSA